MPGSWIFGSSSVLFRERFLKTSLVLFILAVSFLCLTPPIDRDGLVHHLNIPKLYLQHGGMIEFPGMDFSYFPMNLDMLYMIPLYFGNDIAPKLIHFSFGLATAWLIYRYVKKRLGVSYGWIGALFFLSTPVIVKLSITVYVDLGLIFFSFLSLVLVFRWIETGFTSKYLIYAAVACGLGMGTKYNGLVTFLLLSFFVPFVFASRHRHEKQTFLKTAFSGLLFVSVAMTIFSPWMIRNWRWTGNPVYPLYNGVFNPERPAASPQDSPEEAAESTSGVWNFRKLVYDESSLDIALIPIRIFFQGEDGSGQYFDGRLNPGLLLLSLFAFFGVAQESPLVRAEKMILTWFAVLFFMIAFFSTVMRVRYIGPILPPLAVLSVYGVKNLMAVLAGWRYRTAGMAGICGLVIFFLGLNGTYLVSQYTKLAPYEYVAGKISREDYITRFRPEYPAMRFMNRNLPEDARILFLFNGKRGYYCDRPYVIDYMNGRSLLEEFVRTSGSAGDIVKKARAVGITHFLIGLQPFSEWVTDHFAPEKQMLLDEFLNGYVRLMYTDKGFAVFALP